MDNQSRKLLVLDTNIMMSDALAIYRFDEHDIYLPMVVLEELDSHKTGLSEVARNVRQTNRLLDEMMRDASHAEITAGLPIPSFAEQTHPTGRLFFQTEEFDPIALQHSLPGHKVDNAILATTLGLKKCYPQRTVILISKDINLRIKAGILGLVAQDYHHEKVLDDVSLLHQGLHHLANDFWDSHIKDMQAWQENHKTYYQIEGSITQHWHVNDCLATADDSFQGIVKSIKDDKAVVQIARDYTQPKHHVWGVVARNREQNFALNLLLDKDIDFVTLQGSAGTGKTLLTIAAGLTQVLDKNRYVEIIMTRVTIPVGEDIGFLPGTEEEKMTPWMGALLDNLEVLHASQEGGKFGRDATYDLLQSKIKIRSLNFMRGRTFLNRFIIIDEAQNLTAKQIKTLVTRAGPGTKIVCLGDIKQIDTPYLSETTSGLTFAVDRFKDWAYAAHITLARGERSRLAYFAAEHL
ncbi:MAG: phosphate starvation-inducible protein PhoH [Legionellaceae bacterium]|nr:phosphate starvation-inducible protein PhoH [Legionellaceae bacterium]MBJ16466.1 phosphate starvation-inducible protein PhoH [Legionellaceae bacterium]HAF87466.1 phosphate starvation-inducible protein PhoH [Legionellales bacterium]HCA89783.1 phosphate starvation-inducible protein PhoH [Legionellales bacterium]|tara:strand:- start:962 stop:2356 length:1395 start_codon:yes stop_codon:yes gene_type:complete